MDERVGDGVRSGRRGEVLALGATVALVAVVMGILLALRDSAEASVANAASLLPVGYAVAAGMVASVNPCGFFLLPSYIAYHLGTQEERFATTPALSRLARAVVLSLVATGGFVVVFASAGSIIGLGGREIIRFFPAAGLLIGVAMAALGVWLLVTHRAFGLMVASRLAITPRRNLGNVFLFGIAYAVGSLSCTLPVFLVVVGSALLTRGFVASLNQFLGYSLGMGLILALVTVGAALFRDSVSRFLRGMLPRVHTISALFLVGAGLYLVYYWLSYAYILQ